MRTFVFLNDAVFVPVIKKYLTKSTDAVLIVRDARLADTLSRRKGPLVRVCRTLADKKLFDELAIRREDSVFLCLSGKSLIVRCIEHIRSAEAHTPIIIMAAGEKGLPDHAGYAHVYGFSIERLVSAQFSLILRKIENRKKIEQLRNMSRDAENVLILVQNDPDPDALASGLALRVILGRNKQTAPIATFGEVTRSENMNMMSMLDIPVMQVTDGMLAQFSRIALVDVQPPYFRDSDMKADIVIDHHSYQEKYSCGFEDIRPGYGATATILAEYLMDAGFKITQRLATALFYGIKTDTMFLDRGLSPSDIEAFTCLYPLANLNMIRQIEHAQIGYSEIGSFIKAMKNVTLTENMLFSYLGSVPREDIIPRLADVCLQIGGTQWAFVTGIYNYNVVCCIRNVGYVKHAGDLASSAFGDIGSAGGHRYMAKAVIPLGTFKKQFGITARGQIAGKIIEVFKRVQE